MAGQGFEYVIVGGGLSGCVLASRLSQAGKRVLLVEFGPDVVHDPAVKNPLLVGTLPDKGLEVDYQTVPQKHCDNRRIVNHAGRMLSGGSGGNYFCWSSPASIDFKHWANMSGNKRWTFENLLTYMNKAEHWYDPQASTRYHGFHGPIHTNAGREYPMREMLRKALLANGYKENIEACDGDPLGFSTWVESIRVLDSSVAERQYAGYCYDLSKANVMADSPVRRVLVEDNGSSKICKGVELVDGREFIASKEVIICAGAHKTPQILMLSGIGDKAQLDSIGIPQLVAAPEVGRNLCDHLGLFQYYKLKHAEKGYAVGSTTFNKPEYSHGAPVDYLTRFTLSSELKDSGQTNGPTSDQDDTEDDAHLRCHGLHLIFYDPILYPSTVRDGSLIASITVSTQPIARGTITLASDDPLAHPLTDQSYLDNERDRYVLRESVRKVLRVLESPSMSPEVEGEVPPEGWKAITSVSSDNDIDARIRNGCIPIHHPMGTAAMGKVVDGDLKVKGVESLRIVDSSVFPTPISTMPQATLYGIAEMMADVILSGA